MIADQSMWKYLTSPADPYNYDTFLLLIFTLAVATRKSSHDMQPKKLNRHKFYLGAKFCKKNTNHKRGEEYTVACKVNRFFVIFSRYSSR